MNPIVFVITPFGKKKKPNTKLEFDFDRLYTDIFEYLEQDTDLGLNFVREDLACTQGIIHKTMIEKILLAEFAIADLSFSNANAYYELGIRHCAKEQCTLILFSDDNLKFDVSPIKAIKYSIDNGDYLSPKEITRLRDLIKQKLLQAKQNKEIDSPIYDLLPNININIELNELDTKSFKQRALELEMRINYIKQQVRECTKLNRVEKICLIRDLLNRLELTDTTFILWQEAIRAFIDIEAYQDIIDVVQNIPMEYINSSLYIRQKYGFSLNRLGRSLEAVEIFEKCLIDFGEDPETYGLLGRVYKDLYNKTESVNIEKKSGYLDKAIEIYLKGFQKDPSNYFTGINVANLLFNKNTETAFNKMQEILTVIKFVLSNSPDDYWNIATLLNCSILEQNFHYAYEHILPKLVATEAPAWMFKTTKYSIDGIIEQYDKMRIRNDYLQKIQTVIENRILETDIVVE